MKLNAKEFKRFKELQAKVKSGKASSQDEAELNELLAKRNEKGSNDIKWWANYPLLLKDTTNIAFNYIQGTSFDTMGNQNNNLVLKFGSVAVAKYVQTIGLSRTSGDAFNAQMRQLWLDMHRKYRGIGAYQRSDLGMVILAITALFSTISKFERIYGVLNTFKIANRSIPYTWIDALSIDEGDISDKLADFRYNLNFRIAKLQQLCLPKGIALLESEFINCGSIFKDSENARASTFMFDPESFGVYDPTLLSTGGCVKYFDYAQHMSGISPNGSPAFTFNDVFNILDIQISALLEDDDVAKICSDMLAAYGANNVATLVPVPELYVIEPVHDYERLLQFHNLTVVGKVQSVYTNANVVSSATANSLHTAGIDTVIWQDGDVILNMLSTCGSDDPLYVTAGSRVIYADDDQQEASNTTIGLSHDVLFNTWVENPGEVEVMCGTRFTSLVGNETEVATGRYASYVEAFGTCVVTQLVVYNRVSSGGVVGRSIEGSVCNISVVDRQFMAQLSQFDWHPRLYLYDGGELFHFADVDNCAMISRQTLERIHEVALFSGLHVPVTPLEQ